jgi:hypothetical protein
LTAGFRRIPLRQTQEADMPWKTDFRSLYYMGAPAPEDPVIDPKSTALLVIDVQNTYLTRPDRASLSPDEQHRYDLWTPFHERMHKQGPRH